MKLEIEVKGMTASHAPAWKEIIETILTKHYNDKINLKAEDGTEPDTTFVAGDGGVPIAVGMLVLPQGAEEAVVLQGLNRPQDGLAVYRHVMNQGKRKDPELLQMFVQTLHGAAEYFLHALVGIIQQRKHRMEQMGRLN